MSTRPTKESKQSGFAFVNSSGPGDAQTLQAKSIIRRHAMKGIGRARRKRPRAQIVQLKLLEEHEHGAQPTLTRPPIHSAIVGLDLDERDLQLAYFVRARADCAYHPFQTVWVRIGLSDQAAFYLSMATSVHFQDQQDSIPTVGLPEKHESARYYCKALNQLMPRLKDPREYLSLGVIATIVGCLCHDSHVGNWRQWAVHMGGLHRLSSLRGGLEGLECHLSLMAFWLDLVGSAVFDTPPRFPIPPELPSYDIQLLGYQLQLFLLGINPLYPQSSWLVDALEMMSFISGKVNGGAGSPQFWQNEIGAIQMLGPITHHLLSMPREHGTSAENDNVPTAFELARLACLLLLSGLKERFTLSFADSDPLQSRFAQALTRRACPREHGPTLDLELWTLITVSLLWKKDMYTRSSLIMLLVKTLAGQQGLLSAKDAIDFAKSIIWIDCLQGHRVSEWATEFATIALTTSSSQLDL